MRTVKENCLKLLKVTPPASRHSIQSRHYSGVYFILFADLNAGCTGLNIMQRLIHIRLNLSSSKGSEFTIFTFNFALFLFHFTLCALFLLLSHWNKKSLCRVISYSDQDSGKHDFCLFVGLHAAHGKEIHNLFCVVEGALLSSQWLGGRHFAHKPHCLPTVVFSSK